MTAGPTGGQRNVKNEAFPVLLQILHTRHVDSPVMLWIQINARGSGHDPPEIL